MKKTYCLRWVSIYVTIWLVNMTININKAQIGMLNKTIEVIEETNSVTYSIEMTVSDFGFFLKPWKLSCFRLNIMRQAITFSYQFEFYFEDCELFTIYTYFLFAALIR